MLRDVCSYSMRLSTLPAIASFKASVAHHERIQHMRDQRHGIERFPVGQSMQRGVAVELGFQTGWACEGQFDCFGLGQRPKPQFPGLCVHRDVPRLKNMGWYDRSTKSLLTMIRTGKPGRLVSVGWMLRLRRVIF